MKFEDLQVPVAMQPEAMDLLSEKRVESLRHRTPYYNHNVTFTAGDSLLTLRVYAKPGHLTGHLRDQIERFVLTRRPT